MRCACGRDVGYINGVLKIANGEAVTFATMVHPRRLGAVLGLQILIGAGVLIGSVLCVLPGMAVAFLTLFAAFVLLDRDVSIPAAIKTSARLVKANFPTVLLMYLICAAIATGGQLACLVGLLVAIPLGLLYQTYTYRFVSGGQLVPANGEPQ